MDRVSYFSLRKFVHPFVNASKHSLELFGIYLMSNIKFMHDLLVGIGAETNGNFAISNIQFKNKRMNKYSFNTLPLPSAWTEGPQEPKKKLTSHFKKTVSSDAAPPPVVKTRDVKESCSTSQGMISISTDGSATCKCTGSHGRWCGLAWCFLVRSLFC